MRRGWEPDGDNAKRSITEMEHDWAREVGCRRYLWVSPDDFPVPGNLRESDEAHQRQQAFRQRIMAGGERIVSQKGFGSPDLLASEIVEQLLVQIATRRLIEAVPSRPSLPNGSAEEQAPAVAAAVEKLSSDDDLDLLALANDPKDIDLADLEAKLKARAAVHEAAARTKAEPELKASAEYWRHIGALAFLHDTQKALTAYEKAVELDGLQVEAWEKIGLLKERIGELTAAENAFREMSTIGRHDGDAAIEAAALRRLGTVQWRRGDLANAEALYHKSLGIAMRTNRKDMVAAAYCNLGIVHQTRGELDKAEEMQLKSLKLEEELGRKEGMANTYGNLGIIYRARRELDKAEEMQLKSLKFEEELGRKEGMAASYGNLGNIHRERGELDKAEEMQVKSLKLEEELGSKEGMAITYGSLGNLHADRGRIAQACECWRKARDLYREMGLSKQASEWEAWMRHCECGGV